MAGTTAGLLQVGNALHGSASGQDSSPPTVEAGEDTGILCLAVLLHYLKPAADPDLTKHDHARDERSAAGLVRAAKKCKVNTRADAIKTRQIIRIMRKIPSQKLTIASGLLSCLLFAAPSLVIAGPEEEHIENFPIFYDCPDDISPAGPRVTTTRHGLPLTTPIGLRQDGVEFLIPAGYLNPWTERPPDQIQPGMTDIKTSTINFAFWMPSGRFPERNPFWIASYSPCESGRSTPKENEFIVRGFITMPMLDTLSSYTRPSESALRYEHQLSQSGDRYSLSPLEEAYGLKRYAVIVKGKPYYRYQQLNDSNPEIIIDCSHYWTRYPNPNCKAWVFYSSKNLGFGIHFPKRSLPSWLEIANTARDLIMKWNRK